MAYAALGQSEACWDDALNDRLVAACQGNQSYCAPGNVARLLELPYCKGNCEGGIEPIWLVAIGAAALVLALGGRRRQNAR